MGKLFPTVEQNIDFKDGNNIKVLKVVTLTSSDYVAIGRSEDARVLLGAGQSLPTFYLSPNIQNTNATFQRNVLNIDGATAGSEFLIAVRQSGTINRNPNLSNT